MKKIILLCSIISLVAVWFYASSSNDEQQPNPKYLAAPKKEENKSNTPTEEKSPAQAQDIGRTHAQDPLWDYELKISPQIRKTNDWARLNHYQLSEKELVFQTKDIGGLLETCTELATTLARCLKEDLCGIKESPNHPYFRPEETPAHELLIRTLLVQQEMVKQGLISIEEVSTQNLQSMLRFENMELQNIALHLLSKKELSMTQMEDILAEEALTTTEAKATAFVELATQSQKSREARKIFIQALEKSFAQDAPISVLSTLKELDKVELSRKEFDKLLPKLCHIKSENPQNWSRIKYHVTGYIEQSGIKSDSNFCD